MFYSNKKNKDGDLRFLETIITKEDKIISRKKILQIYSYYGWGWGVWSDLPCVREVHEESKFDCEL